MKLFPKHVLNDEMDSVFAGHPGMVNRNPFAGAPARKDGNLATELKELIKDASEKADAARKEVEKKQGEIDGAVNKINEEIESRGQETVELKTQFQDQVSLVAKLEKDFDDLVERLDTISKAATVVDAPWWEQAAACEALKEYTGGPLTLLKYEGPAFRKDLTSLTPSAGTLIQPDWQTGIVTPPQTMLTVRDLLSVVRTTSNSIEWAQELLFSNNAAMQTAEGAAKAKSDITFEVKNSPVQTLAHWFAASRQVLADVPSLEDYIRNRGLYGLKLVEEGQLLAGDGTGTNLLGILPQATAYDDTLEGAGEQKIDRLRRAILQGRQALYPVDSFVMDPKSWCDVELTKTSEGAYIFANPVDGTTPRIWGKRVVESDSMAANSFLTGAFSSGATLWDRELVTVRVADQHANFFIENMVAILIEERLALTVERPAAFVTGTFA